MAYAIRNRQYRYIVSETQLSSSVCNFTATAACARQLDSIDSWWWWTFVLRMVPCIVQVNMKYDAKKYEPVWSEQVSQQLYSCAKSDNPAALVCDETVNLAEPPGGPSASIKATMATLHAQLKAALHEGTVSLETDKLSQPGDQ
jgi:hypothetical protein